MTTALFHSNTCRCPGGVNVIVLCGLMSSTPCSGVQRILLTFPCFCFQFRLEFFSLSALVNKEVQAGWPLLCKLQSLAGGEKSLQPHTTRTSPGPGSQGRLSLLFLAAPWGLHLTGPLGILLHLLDSSYPFPDSSVSPTDVFPAA